MKDGFHDNRGRGPDELDTVFRDRLGGAMITPAALMQGHPTPDDGARADLPHPGHLQPHSRAGPGPRTDAGLPGRDRGVQRLAQRPRPAGPPRPHLLLAGVLWLHLVTTWYPFTSTLGSLGGRIRPAR
ncbi:hypothetical protein GCM10022226_19270 [Sphaerisporangium flaviroseum]|uniref:Uncharacterized protein n=1 Tax=Sphaerisporangium flaviroseum TaxID=509199 RepID=A0ABP7HMW7_9ACTN